MFSITDDEFWKLSNYIKQNYGINLKEEKRTLVIGRIHTLLSQLNFNSFSEYYDYILSDKTGQAAATLVSKISTNHTYFMREADHFDYFRNEVLPSISKMVKDKDLRIWSAGCSSGEEPYTLAMVIDEFFGKEKIRWDTKILATDISDKVLMKAAEGVYPNDDVTELPPNWRLNYFMKIDDENFKIVDKIKNEVIFRKFNLMEQHFPFRKKFHVIFCRNVMIYFDAQTKKDLVQRFYESIEYGGYLFIGHSESLNRWETDFKYVKPAVYKKER